MILLKDLIKKSSFTKAKGFDELKPLVSILLPTYKRGDNGIFERAVNSILNQEFKNFELIIIDDASVDSTASLIQKFMEKDPRVAVIRHAENLGLAAVSEAEAYYKARGQKILSAFDDDVYTTDALALLVKDQTQHPSHKITFGLTRLYLPGNQHIDLGTLPVHWGTLTHGNLIGHPSVLVDREVFETVGLYDPHLALMRVWDWDLWIRASAKFAFHRVNKIVVEEFGGVLDDSLGNTVGIDWAILRIWMERYRNKELLPQNLPEYQLDSMPQYTGPYFKQALAEIVFNRFKGKYLTECSTCLNDGYIAVVAGVKSVSVSLVFDALKEGVVFVPFHALEREFNKYVAGAKAIIFVRDIPSPLIIKKLLTTQTPYHYFTDDQLFIIPEFDPTHNTQMAHAFIHNAKSLMASTPALVENLKEHFGRKETGEVFPCIRPYYLEENYKQDLSKFDCFDTIRIGWCSVGKEDGLIAIKDGLEKLAQKTGKKIEFFCVGTDFSISKLKKEFNDNPYISMQYTGTELNYEWMLTQLNTFNPHFLIHTHTNLWSQIYPYKTFNYFLTAWHLNAVPLITLRPPYEKIQNDPDVKSFILKDGEAILKQLEHYIQAGRPAAQDALKHIERFWQRMYPVETTRKQLHKLMEGPCLSQMQNRMEKLEAELTALCMTQLTQGAPSDPPATWKRWRQQVRTTFKYYMLGKPDQYRYPIKHNMSHLWAETKKTLIWNFSKTEKKQ